MSYDQNLIPENLMAMIDSVANPKGHSKSKNVKNDVAVCDEGVIPFEGIDKDVKLFRLIGYYNEQGNLITHDKGYEKISFTRGSVYCGTPLAGNLVNIFYDSEDSKDVNVDSKISKNVA